MKFILCLVIFSQFASAQNLSPEEQKRLIEENKILKEELKKARSEPAPQDTAKIMEALQRGKKYQEDSNKLLEELDKEE